MDLYRDSEICSVSLFREVLPKIATDYQIKFAKSPELTEVLQPSRSQSEDFTDKNLRGLDQQFPEDPKTPDGAWEYHENLIKKSPPKPIRVWLEVSEKDNGFDRDEASLHNWVMANQRISG